VARETNKWCPPFGNKFSPSISMEICNIWHIAPVSVGQYHAFRAAGTSSSSFMM
jgi:hypothetical protein